MESLWGFLSVPRERGFFRTVEVEKALRNAGGIWPSLISVPARMGLAVCALPGREFQLPGIPGSCPWHLCLLPPSPPPAVEAVHKQRLVPSERRGASSSCAKKTGETQWEPVKNQINFLCPSRSSAVPRLSLPGSHIGFVC